MTDKLTLAEEIEALVVDGCDCEDCRVIRTVAARLRVLAGELRRTADHMVPDGAAILDCADELALEIEPPRTK